MTKVFKKNLHLGTLDPLVETDDIADGAVTKEKLSDDVIEYIEDTSSLSEDIATEIARAKESEQAIKDEIATEASRAQSAEAEKSNIVDIAKYMASDFALPLNGCYVYNGLPLHARQATLLDTDFDKSAAAGDETEGMVFCVSDHSPEQSNAVIYVMYNTKGEYLGSAKYAEASEHLKAIFGENEASSTYAGKMSIEDKANLDKAALADKANLFTEIQQYGYNSGTEPSLYTTVNNGGVTAYNTNPQMISAEGTSALSSDGLSIMHGITENAILTADALKIGNPSTEMYYTFSPQMITSLVESVNALLATLTTQTLAYDTEEGKFIIETTE